MKRREFFTLLGGAAAAWPFVASAQRAERVSIVGVLSSGTAVRAHEGVDELIQALRTLGYFEGKNIEYVVRFAEGKINLLPSLASELVALNADVIVASTTPAIRAAQEASRVIPIVMVNTADPIRLGFIQSLARPGGNITGLSNQVADLGSKQLQLLKEIVPNAKRVGVLINPRNPSHERWPDYRNPAARLGLSLVPVEATDDASLANALAALERDQPDAILVFGDPVFMNGRTRLAEWEKTVRRPAIYPFSEHVQAGGLLSYGPSFRGAYRHVAVYVNKLLKGANPADLPVEQPTKFDLVINFKTAKALGLELPQSLLTSADEVIE